MIPERFQPVNNGKEYSTLLNANQPGWWAITLPVPAAWLRRLGIGKRQPLQVQFYTDPRLKFDHLIIVPTQQADQNI